MRQGLFDYVSMNPYTEPELFEPPAETEEERLFRRIREGVERGEPEKGILIKCLSLIGKLSHDQAWADELKKKLTKKEKPVTELDIPL